MWTVTRTSVDCDNVIVLKLSGALLGTEEDCLFLSTYVPHCGSRFYESAESNCHIAEAEQCICELLERFGDVNLICNGDLTPGRLHIKLTKPWHRIVGSRMM